MHTTSLLARSRRRTSAGLSFALALALAAGVGLPIVAYDSPASAAVPAPTRTPRPGVGEGTVSVDAESYQPAGRVTVKGSGFVAGNQLSLKINDGAVRNADGEDVVATADVGADGTFTVTVDIAPFDLGEGTHWFRILGSQPQVSKFVTFAVSTTPAPAPTTAVPAPTTPAPAPTTAVPAPTTAVPSTAPSAVPSAAPTATSDYTVNKDASVTPVPGTDATKAGSVAGVETQVVRGLYQTAYSSKHNAIYVTSAVGRPPVRDSALVKLDADSLKVQASVFPEVDPQATDRQGNPVDGFRFAVYGVGVDDANNRVWVTNTRQNTVAVYDATTLELVKQFPKNAVNHSRDVVIDSKTNRVFVSSARNNQVAVFDATTLEQLDSITIGAGREEFSSMSLDLDSESGTLVLVSSTDKVALISTADSKVQKVIDLPDGVDNASGVAYNPATGRIYVADQGSGSLTVIEKDGTLVSTAPTATGLKNNEGKDISSGALNVAVDTVNGLVYVSNRQAGTITVHDLDGKLVQTLDSGKFANHVEADGRGNVYAVNKGGSRDGQSPIDYIQRFSVVKDAPSAAPSAAPADPSAAPADPSAAPSAAPSATPADPSSASSASANPAAPSAGPAKPTDTAGASAGPAGAGQASGRPGGAPAAAPAANKPSALARTGASLGVLAVAGGLLAAGGLLIARRRRA